MKQTYSLIVMFFMTAIAFAQQPIITTIVDGSCTSTPKFFEIYAESSVDLSLYAVQLQSNANTTWGTAYELNNFENRTGSFVYIIANTASQTTFQSEFPGVAATAIDVSGVANFNGDDRVRIIEIATGNVVDQYGEEGIDGTGTSWEYLDTYANRLNGTGPDAGFNSANWSYAPINALDTQGTCNGGTENLQTVTNAGTYTATATTDPTLNINGAPVAGLDYFENNGPSAAQNFTVAGSNLTSDVSISADANFEISFQESAGYQATLSISPTNGEVPSTTIYVRLSAGLTAGNYDGTVNVGTTGATTEAVAVSGEVMADDPFITLGGFIDGLSYNEGSGPSASDTFGVSGMFLTTDITVSVDNEFELSLDEMGTYASSLTITPVDGSVDNTTVYIRLRAGETTGDYTGTVTASSTGATNQTLSTSGTVNAAATCAAQGSIIITEVLPNPGVTTDVNGEYFELYNTTDNAINIQSWVIKDLGSDEHTITASVIIPSKGYVLLARSGTDNGGLTPNYVYAGFSLSNSGDEVIIECGGNSIDEVVYDGSWPYSNGVSMELSIENLNSVANDIKENWLAATTAYGDGDLGTPGTVNDATLSNTSLSAASFSIYPNPATTGQLFVDAVNGGSFDVAIYSTLGQQVIVQKSVSNAINISNLNTGLYLVKISQGDASLTRKLIVK